MLHGAILPARPLLPASFWRRALTTLARWCLSCLSYLSSIGPGYTTVHRCGSGETGGLVVLARVDASSLRVLALIMRARFAGAHSFEDILMNVVAIRDPDCLHGYRDRLKAKVDGVAMNT